MPNLVQSWFPGVHINSGGGSTKNLLTMLSTESAAPGQPVAVFTQETDMEELADITFAWMVDLSSSFLAFDPEYLSHLSDQHGNYLHHRSQLHGGTDPGYASGPLKDTYISYFGALMGGSMARSPGQYDKRNKKPSASYISQDTNEYFHPAVRARWDKLGSAWRPEALQGWRVALEKSEIKSEWVWTKALPDGKTLRIPEYGIFGPGASLMERQLIGEERIKALGANH